MIEFRDVSKKYSDAFALQRVTFAINRGELVFLTGPSGAGKSTLMKMIAAIERPSSGTVSVNGQDIGRLNKAGIPFLRRNLGLVFQKQHLLLDRSVLANVMYPLMVTGTSKPEADTRARAALDLVGLLDRWQSLPLTLSGGEQQRALIARAIVNRPQIILADEPTANLDKDSAKLVLAALKTFHTAGITCLISTHDETNFDADGRVIYLNRGQLESRKTNPIVTSATATAKGVE